MKNFPHQFNNLDKLLNALFAIKDLIAEETPLKDEHFGELLTRKGIYTYRDKSLSINDFLLKESRKPKANRGYLTVARDIRRLFKLLGFVTVFKDKSGQLSTAALQLLSTSSTEMQTKLWKNAFLQLGLAGQDGEISHPYRLLLKLVQDLPGIATKKLFLVLEAENDTKEEYARILQLATQSFEEIVENIHTSASMVKNAIKILPAVAEQLGDIIRKNNRVFPVGEMVITEDDITTVVPDIIRSDYQQYRAVTAKTIAKAPIFKNVANVSIDLTESIQIRQDRLALHQEIVRKLGLLCETTNFDLYEGKFDCLATKFKTALLFEVKTIKNSSTDQEKQTVKGVGQLKYYKFSIVQQQMQYTTIKEFIVYSQKPNQHFIEFCHIEDIDVIWLEEEEFKIINKATKQVINFAPLSFS